MNAPFPSTASSRLRRLFPGSVLAGGLVFVVAFFALPRLLAVLMTEHFTQHDSSYLYVAVQTGRGPFELVPLSAPATLRAPAFTSDGERPSAPHATEATQRVRVVQRDGAGTLMETVWSSDDTAITSRYLVTGQRVVPVARQVFGLPQVVLGTLIAAVLAVAAAQLRARRRSASVEFD